MVSFSEHRLPGVWPVWPVCTLCLVYEDRPKPWFQVIQGKSIPDFLHFQRLTQKYPRGFVALRSCERCFHCAFFHMSLCVCVFKGKTQPAGWQKLSWSQNFPRTPKLRDAIFHLLGLGASSWYLTIFRIEGAFHQQPGGIGDICYEISLESEFAFGPFLSKFAVSSRKNLWPKIPQKITWNSPRPHKPLMYATCDLLDLKDVNVSSPSCRGQFANFGKFQPFQ